MPHTPWPPLPLPTNSWTPNTLYHPMPGLPPHYPPTLGPPPPPTHLPPGQQPTPGPPPPPTPPSPRPPIALPTHPSTPPPPIHPPFYPTTNYPLTHWTPTTPYPPTPRPLLPPILPPEPPPALHPPTHPPPGPPLPPGRVLCTVLITIPGAGPPSLIKFHSIDNEQHTFHARWIGCVHINVQQPFPVHAFPHNNVPEKVVWEVKLIN